jgi:hypothetical protein
MRAVPQVDANCPPPSQFATRRNFEKWQRAFSAVGKFFKIKKTSGLARNDFVEPELTEKTEVEKKLPFAGGSNDPLHQTGI